MEPVDVIPGGLEIGRFDGDEPGETIGMHRRQLQSDPASHGAPREQWVLQPQRTAEREHRFNVGSGGQQVFRRLEAFRWQGLAVPGHVECQEAVRTGERLVVENEPPLARIGSGGMQAYNRAALAGFLEVNPQWCAIDGQADIPAGDRFDRRCHGRSSRRPSAMNSLK
jgi:hypothetical protein